MFRICYGHKGGSHLQVWKQNEYQISPTILEEPSESEWNPSAVMLALLIIEPIIIFNAATTKLASKIINRTYLYFFKIDFFP